MASTGKVRSLNINAENMKSKKLRMIWQNVVQLKERLHKFDFYNFKNLPHFLRYLSDKIQTQYCYIKYISFKENLESLVIIWKLLSMQRRKVSDKQKRCDTNSISIYALKNRGLCLFPVMYWSCTQRPTCRTL